MIGLFTSPTNGDRYSDRGTMSRPIVFDFDPTGGTSVTTVYLRHDVLSGTRSEASYNVVLTPASVSLGGREDWVTLSFEDPEDYNTSLDVGDVIGGTIVPILIRVEAPSGEDIGQLDDVYINISADSVYSEFPIDLSSGTHVNVRFDESDRYLKYNTEDLIGSWTSEWMDSSFVDQFYNFERDISGTGVYVSFRSSVDGTDLTASAWVGDVSSVLDQDYFQIKVEFNSDSPLDHQGLAKSIYRNTDFSVFVRSSVGALPYSTDPAESVPPSTSVRYSGYIYIENSGQQIFHTVSQDGARVIVDENTILELWTSVTGSATNTGQGSIFLAEGWHSITVEWFNDLVGSQKNLQLDITPFGQARRPVVFSDFSYHPYEYTLGSVRLTYGGGMNLPVDMRFYYGPDVPVLVSPESDYATRDFRPELTVWKFSAREVEFQLDTAITFASVDLAQWTEESDEIEVSSRPPTGQRPAGIYYWRARGLLAGENSEWSEWRRLEILPILPEDEFIYLHANIGLEEVDPMDYDQTLYIHVNVGFEPHDPIDDNRYDYLNANNAQGNAVVVYPILDKTLARKIEWEGDDDIFTDGVDDTV